MCPPLKSCICPRKSLTDRLTRRFQDALIAAGIPSVYASIRFHLYKYRHTRLTCEHRHWYFNTTDAWKYGSDNKRMNLHTKLIKSLCFGCDQLFSRHILTSINSLLNSHRLVHYNHQMLHSLVWELTSIYTSSLPTVITVMTAGDHFSSPPIDHCFDL